MVSGSVSERIYKAAKKSLKTQDAKTMKLKLLVKAVCSKIGDDVDPKQIKAWIKKSEKFCLEGKNVSLAGKRKRSVAPAVPDEPPSKKSKAVEGTTIAASTWRSENKVVIKSARDDDLGQQDSEKINSDESLAPFQSFDDQVCKDKIHPHLLRQCVEGNGFTKPSPIQAQAWSILMSSVNGRKRDIVGISETGSGKTLAFSLPALTSMAQQTVGKRRLPRMLILAPTRELAMQAQEVLQEFGSILSLRSLVVYGGVPKHTQASELKKKAVDIVVATPGRLKDLINDGVCDLSSVDQLVLDEADRMIDVGFEEDVRYIVSQCKSKDAGRQTAMFSATWPAAIQKIAMDFMVDPIRVYVGFESIVGSNGEDNIDDSLSANKRVEQRVEVIEDRAREQRLRELLRKHQKGNPRILIFALYKKEAERLEYSLKREGFNVCSIHGNKSQEARNSALADFKSGSCPLMVATDVAARGLDIPNVEVVLNYTFPLTIEDYVHRIGRTGRAGKNGISYTFFQPGDKSHAGELQQVMRQAGQEPPEDLLKFGSTIKKKEHKLYGNFGPRGGAPMKKATKITFNFSED